MSLLELDALMAAECFRRAAGMANRLMDGDDLPKDESWIVRERRARLALQSDTVDLDEALIDLEGIETADDVPSTVAAEVVACLIEGYAVKRSWELVARTTSSARKRLGTRRAVTIAEGRAAVAATLLVSARHKFESVLDNDADNPESHLELARVLRLLGQPREALAHLKEIARDSDLWPRAARLRADVCASIGEPLAEAGHWAALIEERPSSDLRVESYLRLGMALSIAGRPHEATIALQASWRL